MQKALLIVALLILLVACGESEPMTTRTPTPTQVPPTPTATATPTPVPTATTTPTQEPIEISGNGTRRIPIELQAGLWTVEIAIMDNEDCSLRSCQPSYFSVWVESVFGDNLSANEVVQQVQAGKCEDFLASMPMVSFNPSANQIAMFEECADYFAGNTTVYGSIGLASEFADEWAGSTTVHVGSGQFALTPGKQIVSVEAEGSWALRFVLE